jgi:transposase-like protein
MTVREIAGFLLDHYKVEVSADFISTVTDSVLEAVVECRIGLWSAAIRWSISTRCG